MSDTKITFQSQGRRLSGAVRVPDSVKPGEKRPAFIVMHGFGSNSSSSNVLEPCAMFEKLGYVTLRFDMPGCGESEGERGNLICLEQVQAASDDLDFKHVPRHRALDRDRPGEKMRPWAPFFHFRVHFLHFTDGIVRLGAKFLQHLGNSANRVDGDGLAWLHSKYGFRIGSEKSPLNS